MVDWTDQRVVGLKTRRKLFVSILFLKESTMLTTLTVISVLSTVIALATSVLSIYLLKERRIDQKLKEQYLSRLEETERFLFDAYDEINDLT